MRARTAVLTASLAIGGLLACAAPVSGGIACQQKINCNASPIWHYYGKTPAENDIYRCINTTVNFSVSTDQNDNDTCVDDSEICLDGPISYTWSGVTDTHTSTASGSWSSSGTYTVTCTMTDPGNYVKDKTETATWTVHVFRLASVTVDYDPQEVHKPVTFTAETDPPGYASAIEIQWSGGGDPATGSGPTFTTTWHTAGTYTVTATACGQSIPKTVRIVGGPFLTTPSPESVMACHLRYFCEAPVPPPRDKATVRVRDEQPSGTTFYWIPIGPSIRIDDRYSRETSVFPIAGSSAERDSMVKLYYYLDDFTCFDTNDLEWAKDPEGAGLAYWRFYTVFRPTVLEFYWREDKTGDLGNGFESDIHYMIVSSVRHSYGYHYMATVPYHEVFPNLPETDVIPNNWTVGTAGAGMSGWWMTDVISVTGAGFDPVPQSPYEPPPKTKEYNLVDYWDQLWYAGSTSPGQGCPVQHDILQRYLDHGTHDVAPDPVDPMPFPGNPPPDDRYKKERP